MQVIWKTAGEVDDRLLEAELRCRKNRQEARQLSSVIGASMAAYPSSAQPRREAYMVPGVHLDRRAVAVV
jgi:hypothetical protein